MPSGVLPSPGVGARRRNTPKLPLSAFSPPATGQSSSGFPIAPDPSTMHPASVIDAGVDANNDAVSLILTGPSDALVSSMQAAFGTGHAAELDVQVDLTVDSGWDVLDDVIGKALTVDAERDPVQQRRVVVLNNVLPPPATSDIPVVKLLNHPIYKSYQARIATISLFPSVYVKFAPPEWGVVPHAAAADSITTSTEENSSNDDKLRREWKRKIKMYLGPVIEAFGFSRIIYSSKGSSKTAVSKPNDWYTLARECIAEMGVEQEAIDDVFAGNARGAYQAL